MAAAMVAAVTLVTWLTETVAMARAAADLWIAVVVVEEEPVEEALEVHIPQSQSIECTLQPSL